MNKIFDGVEEAIAEVQAGRLVIVVDDRDREHEGDLIGAAALMRPETINFMVTHGRGAFVAVFTPSGWCDRLGIGPMGGVNDSFNRTNFRLPVDARQGGSGSSAWDRALTVNLLGSASAVAGDFVRPGHVVPIEAVAGGLAQRRGHTEAGVALMQLAGIEPAVAVDLEILDDSGDMARDASLLAFAIKHDLKMITLEDLCAYWLARKPAPAQA